MRVTATSLALAALSATALAKTDLEGCTSSQTIAYGGASMVYWLPDTGEICSFLDCGGGRAPSKTTVPGCPAYVGTATYSPDFLPGFAASTTAAAATQPTDVGASPSVTGSPVVSTTAVAGAGSTAEAISSVISAQISSGASVVGAQTTLKQATNGTAVVTGSPSGATVPVQVNGAGRAASAFGLVAAGLAAAML